MSKTPRTNTIAPVGYARAQDLLLYREVWAGYSNKPADENGHPPVALYTQDQVNAMLTAEREMADRLIAFLADDALAMTYQSLAQYRQAAIDAERRK